MSGSIKKTPTSKRARRIMKQREPKLIEDVKKALVIKGATSSATITDALKDLHKLKAPDSKLLAKKNNIARPFEDHASIEFLSKMNDTSLFIFGSHSKKRPNCLVFGRTFDNQLLDMVECVVNKETYKPMASFTSERSSTVKYGSKPLMVFQGEDFESNPDMQVFRNLMIDFFRGDVLEKIDLAGIDRVMVFTAVGNKVMLRHYATILKKSGSKLPRIELEEAGPVMDLTVLRRKTASDDLHKASMKIPKELTTKLPKNQSRNEMGDSVIKVHMKRQSLEQLAVTKPKGLQRGKRLRDEQGNVEGSGDEGQDTAVDVEEAVSKKGKKKGNARGYGDNKGPKTSGKGGPAKKKLKPEGKSSAKPANYEFAA